MTVDAVAQNLVVEGSDAAIYVPYSATRSLIDALRSTLSPAEQRIHQLKANHASAAEDLKRELDKRQV